jgi:uncharacterized repeat protein (TIGR03806 family)
MRSRSIAFSLLVACALSACARAEEGVDLSRPVRVDLDAPPPERLSSYNLFTWRPADGFEFNDRVVPYDLNTPLFSDYALKQRAIYVPEGAHAVYDPEEAFEFPVGTVLIKSFYFPADLREPDADLTIIETRLFVRHEGGWEAYPYIWDADQRDARLALSGEVRAIELIDREGEPRVASYLVPQRNQCQSCHGIKDEQDETVMVPIGPKARHLHRGYDYGGDAGVVNQIEHLVSLGMLDGVPSLEGIVASYDFAPIEAAGPTAIPAEDIDAAARDYLDVNCAHCHNPRGVQGITSQLFLDRANEDTFHLGYCKRPGSAGSGTGGLNFDIVPGDADASILVFRVETEEVGAMMPLLGRSLTHGHGAELLRAWVDAMPAVDCEAVEP